MRRMRRAGAVQLVKMREHPAESLRRVTLGMTQGEMSTAMGVPQSVLNSVIRGNKRPNEKFYDGLVRVGCDREEMQDVCELWWDEYSEGMRRYALSRVAGMRKASEGAAE